MSTDSALHLFQEKSIVQIIKGRMPLLQIQIPRSLPTHHFGKRITKLNLLFRAFPNVSHPHVASIHWNRSTHQSVSEPNMSNLLR